MRGEGEGREGRGAYREEVVHGGERRGERGRRAASGEESGGRGRRKVWPLRRRGCLKLGREVGWAGVNTAGAEAGRWATRGSFSAGRLASVMESFSFLFFFPIPGV